MGHVSTENALHFFYAFICIENGNTNTQSASCIRLVGHEQCQLNLIMQNHEVGY